MHSTVVGEVEDAPERSLYTRGLVHLRYILLIGAATFILVGSVVYARVTASGWLSLPPKPTGDGPDYDAMAHSITKYGLPACLFGKRLLLDTNDSDWRSLYQGPLPASAVEPTPDANLAPDYKPLLAAEPRLFISTGRPPLFPVVLSTIYAVFGRTPAGMHAVRAFQVVCIALSAALAAALAAAVSWRLTNSRIGFVLAGIGVATLASTNNTLADYATDFLTEPLALLLIQCFVCCVVGFGSNTNFSRGAKLAGLFFGLAILCRSLFVLWLPAVFLLLLVAGRGTFRHRFQDAAWFLLITCLVCLPWWIRNYQVTEGYSPLGTKGALTLLGGYSSESLAADGDWQPGPENALRARMATQDIRTQPPEKLSKFEAARLGTLHEIALARAARDEVAKWINENWANLPTLVGKRIATHWNPYFGQSLLWKLAMMAGAAILLYSASKNTSLHCRDAVWLVGLPIVSTLVTACLYSVGGRFLVPLYGLLMTLAAVGTASVCLRLAQAFRAHPP